MKRKRIEKVVQLSSRSRVSIELPLTLYSQDVQNYEIRLIFKDELGQVLTNETVREVVIGTFYRLGKAEMTDALNFYELDDKGTVMINRIPFIPYYLGSEEAVTVILCLYFVDRDGARTDVGEVRFKAMQSAFDRHWFVKQERSTSLPQPSEVAVVDEGLSPWERVFDDYGEPAEDNVYYGFGDLYELHRSVRTEGKPARVRIGVERSREGSEAIVETSNVGTEEVFDVPSISSEKASEELTAPLDDRVPD